MHAKNLLLWHGGVSSQLGRITSSASCVFGSAHCANSGRGCTGSSRSGHDGGRSCGFSSWCRCWNNHNDRSYGCGWSSNSCCFLLTASSQGNDCNDGGQNERFVHFTILKIKKRKQFPEIVKKSSCQIMLLSQQFNKDCSTRQKDSSSFVQPPSIARIRENKSVCRTNE